MKRWLPFIFLLLAAFSGPAITRQFAPAISDAGGATNRTQTLSWDAEGRLRLVMERNTNNYGFNWSAVYDGLNRRISTTIILVSNGVPSVVPPQMLSSYYDPQTECLELGVLLTAAPQQEFLQSEASPSIQTTWKLYGPDLDGQYGGLNGVGGLDAVSPYQNNFDPVISDARGNVLAEETNGVPYWTLARPTGYGAVPGYRPVAFGNGADMAQSSAWRGHEVDVTGFYYLYDRYYDPVGGQWLSFDPLPNDLDPNGQSFVGGDPVNYFDPDGRYGKGAAVSAGNMLSSAASFAKNTLYAMSYAVSSPFAPDWAYRNYGQQTAAFGNSVKGAAQTTYDVAAMASYGITSPFAPNFAYNNYGGSMERLEKVATALSAGGANNPGAYRAGYTTFNVATVFFGGEVGEVGNAGRAGEVTGVAAQTARTARIASKVWDLAPFARGQQIEQMLGGNLPRSYPVIDRFDFATGVATSIKSIDLNAATYQNAAALTSRLNGYVNSVAEFKGANFSDLPIDASQITTRQLQLAIPSGGMTAAQQAAINAAVLRAQSMGVNFIVTPIP